jgi:hypothetical protein
VRFQVSKEIYHKFSVEIKRKPLSFQMKYQGQPSIGKEVPKKAYSREKGMRMGSGLNISDLPGRITLSYGSV